MNNHEEIMQLSWLGNGSECAISIYLTGQALKNCVIKIGKHYLIRIFGMYSNRFHRSRGYFEIIRYTEMKTTFIIKVM